MYKNYLFPAIYHIYFISLSIMKLSKGLLAIAALAAIAGCTSAECKEVSFDLTDEVFLWWNEKAGDLTPAAGEWELMVGGASDQLRSISFKR